MGLPSRAAPASKSTGNRMRLSSRLTRLRLPSRSPVLPPRLGEVTGCVGVIARAASDRRGAERARDEWRPRSCASWLFIAFQKNAEKTHSAGLPIPDPNSSSVDRSRSPFAFRERRCLNPKALQHGGHGHTVTRALPPADPAVARASSHGSEPLAREDSARARSLRPRRRRRRADKPQTRVAPRTDPGRRRGDHAPLVHGRPEQRSL